MKLIGPNKVLGFLVNFAFRIRRQKLRADRRIKYIQQDSGGCLIDFICMCNPVYQHANQCFGYSCVYAIHGHMVAVISCPAERKFGKVTCTDYKTIGLVC